LSLLIEAVLNMTQDNRIWILMSRHLSGEASPEETNELTNLLEQDPRKQYAYDILQTYFNQAAPPEASPAPENAEMEENLLKIIDLPTARRRLLSPRVKWIAAACTAACLLLGSLLIQRNTPKTLAPLARSIRSEEVLAKAGTRTKLVLPDGTEVWLNSNSRLKYSAGFDQTDREVVLEGEAYFEVAKDARLPFVVHASSIDIKVLGTSFAVKSYPQDETIEATLLKGSIEISRKDNPAGAQIILKPNEKLVFRKSLATFDRTNPSPSKPVINAAPAPDISVNPIRKDLPDSDKVETAWLYNRLVFDGDRFRELADKMERWFNVRIVIRDSGLNNYRFSGIFEKETVDDALKELQLTNDFSFTHKNNGNEIDLYAKN
jgi:transmembrane sensor